MALKIIYYKDTFKVEGEINTITASNFDEHFKALLKSIMNITIDLSEVSRIDADGKNSINNLRQYARLFKRNFHLILSLEQEKTLDFSL